MAFCSAFFLNENDRYDDNVYCFKRDVLWTFKNLEKLKFNYTDLGVDKLKDLFSSKKNDLEMVITMPN